MAVLSAELKKLLVRTKLTVLPEDYLVIRLPQDIKPIPGEWYRPATTRFAVFIREPKEISLIVTRRKWLRMQNIFDRRTVSAPMKVIGFDHKLSMVVPGYMSVIGSILANSKISALPVSTLSSDHILVQKADLPRAVRLLRHLIQNCHE
ncbi:MAG: ACT domain-containing protein [Acidobacteriia bacterium]|nr:ACT domain-containing protein [Terriglobia bacterium]